LLNRPRPTQGCRVNIRSSINPDAITQAGNRTENVRENETIFLEGEPLTFQNNSFVVSREVFAKGESPA